MPVRVEGGPCDCCGSGSGSSGQGPSGSGGESGSGSGSGGGPVGGPVPCCPNGLPLTIQGAFVGCNDDITFTLTWTGSSYVSGYLTWTALAGSCMTVSLFCSLGLGVAWIALLTLHPTCADFPQSGFRAYAIDEDLSGCDPFYMHMVPSGTGPAPPDECRSDEGDYLEFFL